MEPAGQVGEEGLSQMDTSRFLLLQTEKKKGYYIYSCLAQGTEDIFASKDELQQDNQTGLKVTSDDQVVLCALPTPAQLNNLTSVSNIEVKVEQPPMSTDD
ncbi:hypothetical protein Pcinc_005067 [Petrolisthes cinctipes]|uniref:Uncharacterized protein n=1 Tax=Petrolisthes cinctipes TaxID=88211 RepID=A0AAE1GE64_PETCI|nr:hypothetical protein Pcinc_005067 [Petrolisthes cinctipes]